MKLICTYNINDYFLKKRKLINKKYFQLKSNLEKMVKIKFYKASFLNTANFIKYFLCD